MKKKRVLILLISVFLLLGAIACNCEQQQEKVPLPYTDVTFASESDATAAMMRFYDENRTLLTTLMDDLKSPDHGYIENGVVYPVKDGKVLRDSPCSEWPESIDAFFKFSYSDSCALGWDTTSQGLPLFFVSLRWTNDSAYYSTELEFMEDGALMMKKMYDEKGVILEPVYEDSGWGVHTVLWWKNTGRPFF